MPLHGVRLAAARLAPSTVHGVLHHAASAAFATPTGHGGAGRYVASHHVALLHQDQNTRDISRSRAGSRNRPPAVSRTPDSSSTVPPPPEGSGRARHPFQRNRDSERREWHLQSTHGDRSQTAPSAPNTKATWTCPGPLPERADDGIELGAGAAGLAVADATVDAQRPHQVVGLAGRDPWTDASITTAPAPGRSAGAARAGWAERSPRAAGDMQLEVAGLAVAVRDASYQAAPITWVASSSISFWSAMVMAFAQDVHAVTSAIASSRLERDDCARAIRVCLFVVGSGHAEDHTRGPLTSGSAGARSPHNSILVGTLPLLGVPTSASLESSPRAGFEAQPTATYLQPSGTNGSIHGIDSTQGRALPLAPPKAAKNPRSAGQLARRERATPGPHAGTHNAERLPHGTDRRRALRCSGDADVFSEHQAAPRFEHAVHLPHGLLLAFIAPRTADATKD